MRRGPGLASPLMVALALLLPACRDPAPQIGFTVGGKLSGASCTEQTVTGVSPKVKTVRLSVRFRSASGAAVTDAEGHPACDALLDPGSVTTQALAVPAGARVDLFVEAFGEANARIATGAALGVDLG